MTRIVSGIYRGHVSHKRLRPVTHALRYNVFSCLFECGRLPELHRKMKWFSLNRFNIMSIYERDHTDGETLSSYHTKIATDAGMENQIERFFMLCYPRILGYVFNPLTVYFGLNDQEQTVLLIYEVRNTFGGKHTYVVPVERNGRGVIEQKCDKRFYVSPFNGTEGRYHFHVTEPGPEITVGVALRTREGPLLKAHFRGTRHPLTDASLMTALLNTGWLTLKVVSAIHFEALKLWLKGLRLKADTSDTPSNVTHIHPPK